MNKYCKKLRDLIYHSSSTAEVIINMYRSLNRRRRMSFVVFSLMNLSYFVISALVVVLNVYIIRISDLASSGVSETLVVTIYTLYILATLLSVIATVCASIISFMRLRQLIANNEQKYKELRLEILNFKRNIFPYDGPGRDQNIINKANEILAKEISDDDGK